MSIFRNLVFVSRNSKLLMRTHIKNLQFGNRLISSNSYDQEDIKQGSFSKIKNAIVLTTSIGFCFLYYKYFWVKKKNTRTYSDAFIPVVKAIGETPIDPNTPRNKFNFLADVAEKIAPSVVYIEITARHPTTKKRIPLSNGSGFIVKSDGLILTNAHVVAHYGHVIVKLYDGREFEGVIENQDTETDLATVRIKAKNLPVLPLGHSSNLRPGEFVIAMGNPLTLSHTITAGVVSSANRLGKELGLHKKSDYIQTDAAVNIGNSGGPLVNLDGEAIGINTMKVTEGISFAIPSDRAIDFLSRMEKKGKDGRTPFSKSDSAEKQQKFLGITMVSLTPHLIQQFQERNPDFPDVQYGVLVWRVVVGSPAYESDIKPGDVIISINGKKIDAAANVYKMLGTEEVLKVQVVRRRKTLEKYVKLIEPFTL